CAWAGVSTCPASRPGQPRTSVLSAFRSYSSTRAPAASPAPCQTQNQVMAMRVADLSGVEKENQSAIVAATLEPPQTNKFWPVIQLLAGSRKKAMARAT